MHYTNVIAKYVENVISNVVFGVAAGSVRKQYCSGLWKFSSHQKKKNRQEFIYLI